MKRAFTLIELLVVIAIIAILAAILFPVFAQAKVAAKQTQELSSAKQVATAFYIYITDYDDTAPSVSKQKQAGFDGTLTSSFSSWYNELQPYMKSWQLLLSPGRSDTGCVDHVNPTGRCLGFGLNDGLVSDSGYGLLQTQTKDVNHQTLRAGRNLSQVVEPANLLAFGSSQDTPGYSVAMDNILSGYQDGISSKNIRFSGRFSFGFADGHAKSVQVRSAEYPGYGLVLTPANKADAVKWCFDQTFVPDASFATNSFPGDYPLQAGNLTCAQAALDITSNAVINP
jgi:prepilin-type N-terminal cleavage/methylation domain-containing protein/prepilin-type processing-associated H-X9-DG protein